MKKFLLLLLGGFCLFAFPAFAEDLKILKEVENSYQKMKNFKAEFIQELFHRESNTTQKRKGSIEFMPPKFIYWQTEAPEQEIIVSNNKEVWHYLPDEELAYHYSHKVLDTSHAILNVITGQAKLEDSFEIEFLEKTENTQSFTLFPYESNPQMVEVTLTVDTKTKRIQKIVVLDFFGNLNTIEFTEFKENVKLDKKHFDLKIPKDTEIEDHFND